jgi:CRP-like cAMP-binding protein
LTAPRRRPIGAQPAQCARARCTLRAQDASLDREAVGCRVDPTEKRANLAPRDLLDGLTELANSWYRRNSVDRRALALFWHLAERWGQITAAGVELPLRLPHRIIAQMVGARRPTISSALTTLAADGKVTRRPDGGWILHGEPVGVPHQDVCRVIPLRRRRVPAGETIAASPVS